MAKVKWFILQSVRGGGASSTMEAFIHVGFAIVIFVIALVCEAYSFQMPTQYYMRSALTFFYAVILFLSFWQFFTAFIRYERGKGAPIPVLSFLWRMVPFGWLFYQIQTDAKLAQNIWKKEMLYRETLQNRIRKSSKTQRKMADCNQVVRRR